MKDLTDLNSVFTKYSTVLALEEMLDAVLEAHIA